MIKKYEKEQEVKRMAIARQFCKKSEMNSTPIDEIANEATESFEKIKGSKKEVEKQDFQ